MTQTIIKNVTLTVIDCGECGGTYAINERYREQKYQEGGSWKCPYCHTWWGYANNNENARLKRELAEKERVIEERNRSLQWSRDEARRAEARAETDRRRAAAFKGQTTKLKRRVAGGVCPCCTRTFQNLARHMKGQHPEYADSPLLPTGDGR